MLSEFRLRRRVNFYETDAAGLVHFSCFFRYMEEAEHALWRAAGLSIHTRDGEFGFPRVSAAFDFHRALRFEQEFDVLLRVTGMTKKTIRYTCLLLDGESKIATGTLIVACVRRRPNEPMRSIEIPPEITARLHVADESTIAGASPAQSGDASGPGPQ
jgi:acyl-CoA thioester hydrolase